MKVIASCVDINKSFTSLGYLVNDFASLVRSGA